MKIVFASRNPGKVREARELLADFPLDFSSLADYPRIGEIEEDGESFFDNALIKARTVARATGEISLADDSGLEVDFLGGAPGVYSARFAGLEASDEDNLKKLLREMNGVEAEGRGAAFRCVLVLFRPDGGYESFEGTWRGMIAQEPRGAGGFGYDPVFYLPDLGRTAAELPLEMKNRISHRASAFEKLGRSLGKMIKK